MKVAVSLDTWLSSHTISSLHTTIVAQHTFFQPRCTEYKVAHSVLILTLITLKERRHIQFVLTKLSILNGSNRCNASTCITVAVSTYISSVVSVFKWGRFTHCRAHKISILRFSNSTICSKFRHLFNFIATETAK